MSEEQRTWIAALVKKAEAELDAIRKQSQNDDPVGCAAHADQARFLLLVLQKVSKAQP